MFNLFPENIITNKKILNKKTLKIILNQEKKKKKTQIKKQNSKTKK